MRHAAALVVFLSATAAGASSALDPMYGVVLPVTQAKALVRQCSRAGPRSVTGAWSPSPSQIRDLELRLPNAISKQRKHDGRSMDVVRQYAGFISSGRKIIYVNALPRRDTESQMPDEPPEDWKHKALVMCDGGPQFFGVEYDPQTKAFSNFAFNGVL